MKEKSLIIYLYDHFDEISFGFKPDYMKMPAEKGKKLIRT